MKFSNIFALCAALVLCMACEEPSKSYYTASYTITSIEITIDVVEPDQSDPEAPTLKEQIREDVAANLLVAEGGSYTFSFEEFDGGTVTLRRTADATPEVTTFTKVPGANDITIHAASGDLIVTQSTYRSEGQTYNMFTMTLTDHYKALYPDYEVQRVRVLQRAGQ